MKEFKAIKLSYKDRALHLLYAFEELLDPFNKAEVILDDGTIEITPYTWNERKCGFFYHLNRALIGYTMGEVVGNVIMNIECVDTCPSFFSCVKSLLDNILNRYC